MKLKRMFDLLKCIKTDIGFIKIGTRIQFLDNSPINGIIVKIFKTNKSFKVKWDDGDTTKEEFNDLYAYKLII